MKTNTVNISFTKGLLMQIDKAAAEESRTRSEFLREAARAYLERKKQWKDIFSFGKKQADALSLQKSDVAEAIKMYRKAEK